MANLFISTNQLYKISDTTPLTGSTLATPAMMIPTSIDFDELCVNPHWYTNKAFGVELFNASPVNSLLVYFYSVNGVYYQDTLQSTTFKIYGSTDNSTWVLLETTTPEDGQNLVENQSTTDQWVISKLAFKITAATYTYFKLIPQTDLVLQNSAFYGVCFVEAYGQILPDDDVTIGSQAIKSDLTQGNPHAFNGYITGGTVDYHSKWYGPIGQDFGIATTIHAFKVRQLNNLKGDYGFTEIELCGWDGSTWLQLHYENNLPNGNNGLWYYFSVDCPGSYQQYLVRATKNGADADIQEIEMYTTALSIGNLSGNFPALTGSIITTTASCEGDITGDIAALTGSLTATQSSTGSIIGTFTELEGNLTSTEVLQGDINSDLSSMEGGIHSGAILNKSIPALIGEIEGSIGIVSYMSGNLTGLSGTLLSGAKLESDLPVITSNIIGYVGTSARINKQLTKFTGELTGKVTALGNLDSNIPGLNGEVVGISGAIGNIDSTIPRMLGSIVAFAGNIATIDSDVSNLTGEITGNATLIGDIDGLISFTGNINGYSDRLYDDYIIRYRR